jgi:hypothetical protein
MKKIRVFNFTAFYLLVLPACSKPRNENIPLAPAFLTAPANLNDVANERWKLLAEELKIGNNQGYQTSADLSASLANVSEWITKPENASGYKEGFVAPILQNNVSNAYKTQCSGVESVEKLGFAQILNDKNLLPSNIDESTFIYRIKYKLQSANNGSPEEITRNGLLVLPAVNENTQGKTPLLAYGHGGDVGMGVLDLAAGLGHLQKSHIVLAPVYLEEKLCRQGIDWAIQGCQKNSSGAEDIIAKNPGKSEPYVNDADDINGLQNCIARASLPSNSPAFIEVPEVNNLGEKTGATLNSQIFSLVKRIGGTENGTLANLPVSIIAGHSRGSHAAFMALQRSGSVLGVVKEKLEGDTTAATLLGSGYTFPSLYTCSLNNFGPAVFSADKFRLGLEYFIRGWKNSTPFIRLTTGVQLAEKFEAFGAGVGLENAGNAEAEQAWARKYALKLAEIDLSFSAPLIQVALRNFQNLSSSKPGALMLMHSAQDVVVPVSQSVLGGTVMAGVNAQLSALYASGNRNSSGPGFSFSALKVQAGSEYLKPNGELKNLSSAHGDAAYQTGTVSGNLITSSKLPTPVLDSLNSNYDKYKTMSPRAAIEKWRNEDCQRAIEGSVAY